MALFRNYLRMIDGPYPITNAILRHHLKKTRYATILAELWCKTGQHARRLLQIDRTGLNQSQSQFAQDVDSVTKQAQSALQHMY